MILVSVLLCGTGGYFLGRTTAASDADAKRARINATQTSQKTAYRDAFKESKERGGRAGRRRGKSDGTRRAKSAAAKYLKKQKAQAEAVQLSQQSACPSGQQLLRKMDTFYCGRPGPARPEDCPAGWVPAGETGACAPRE